MVCQKWYNVHDGSKGMNDSEILRRGERRYEGRASQEKLGLGKGPEGNE